MLEFVCTPGFADRSLASERARPVFERIARERNPLTSERTSERLIKEESTSERTSERWALGGWTSERTSERSTICERAYERAAKLASERPSEQWQRASERRSEQPAAHERVCERILISATALATSFNINKPVGLPQRLLRGARGLRSRARGIGHTTMCQAYPPLPTTPPPEFVNY